MNKYESIIILSPNINEEDRKKELEKYQKLFESFSDKPVTVEDWGKKKLAYPIQKQNEGYYVLFNFCSNAENIDEIERQYENDDNVIKHIVVKQEPVNENEETMEDNDMEM